MIMPWATKSWENQTHIKMIISDELPVDIFEAGSLLSFMSI